MILLYLFRLYYPALYYASVHAAEFGEVCYRSRIWSSERPLARDRNLGMALFFFFLISLRAHGGTEPYVALHDTVTLYMSLSCSFVCFLSLPLSGGTYIVLISWF